MQLSYEVLEDELDSAAAVLKDHITDNRYDTHGLGVSSVNLRMLEVMTSALSGYWRIVSSENNYTAVLSALTGRSIVGGGIPFDTAARTSGGDIFG